MGRGDLRIKTLPRGVRCQQGRYIASIRHEGRTVYLGSFDSHDEAFAARRNAEMRLFGRYFDRRSIELRGSVALLPLHGQKGRFYGLALVDIADLPIVRDVSWTLDARGYVVGRPAGSRRSVTLHRWLLFRGGDGPSVDHRSRDRKDNRRCNLRTCSSQQNAKNTSLARNSTSGAKGVTRTATGRWRARIWNDRREFHIGTFDTPGEAAEAYDAAAIRLHGDFASPNSDLSSLDGVDAPAIEM